MSGVQSPTVSRTAIVERTGGKSYVVGFDEGGEPTSVLIRWAQRSRWPGNSATHERQFYVWRTGETMSPAVSRAIAAASGGVNLAPRATSPCRLSASELKALLASRVDVDPDTGCHNWTGALTGGYGKVRLGSRVASAHRVIFELTKGPVAAGLHLDHLCRNRRCCNPDHLEPVTAAVNILRGISPLAANARKSSCVRGHPLSGENLYIDPRGHRRCKVCIGLARKGALPNLLP